MSEKKKKHKKIDTLIEINGHLNVARVKLMKINVALLL